jgi:stage IV sporulation protein FB
MFGVPAPTEFDVRFRLLSIPVRVNPLFWVIAAFLGQDVLKLGGSFFVLWIVCVFLSVLVHEFGHGLVARRFGAEPDVLLYGMGGLCIYDNRQSLRQRLLVLLMGPGAGFVLMGTTIAVACLWLRITPGDAWHERYELARVVPTAHGLLAIHFLIQINLFWGIFNLLPIMPLDGGQIAMVLLSMHNPRQGRRRAYIISILTAGLMAIYLVNQKSYFNALLVGLLALSSFQVLQAYHYQSRYGDSIEDDADWWKR